MNLKINVQLNRIPFNIKDDFEKARLYFLKHGINITWVFENIDVHGYTSIWNGRCFTLQGSQNLVKIDLTSDITMFVFDQTEWSGSQRLSTPTGCCFPFNGKPFINISAHIFEHNNGYLATQIAHEIMHALSELSNTVGFHFNDVMDSYFHNEDWDYPNGNFAQMWVLLAPFIASQTNQNALRAILTRNSDDGVQTTGNLVIDDFKCFTLERPWKNNQQNISSIPVGIYQCKYTFSFRMLKYTYELQNVKGRSGIRFHSGNYFFDVAGCILLGDSYADINRDGKTDILNSRKTIQKFEDKMQKLPFTLEIK